MSCDASVPPRPTACTLPIFNLLPPCPRLALSAASSSTPCSAGLSTSAAGALLHAEASGRLHVSSTWSVITTHSTCSTHCNQQGAATTLTLTLKHHTNHRSSIIRSDFINPARHLASRLHVTVARVTNGQDNTSTRLLILPLGQLKSGVDARHGNELHHGEPKLLSRLLRESVPPRAQFSAAIFQPTGQFSESRPYVK